MNIREEIQQARLDGRNDAGILIKELGLDNAIIYAKSIGDATRNAPSAREFGYIDGFMGEVASKINAARHFKATRTGLESPQYRAGHGAGFALAKHRNRNGLDIYDISKFVIDITHQDTGRIDDYKLGYVDGFVSALLESSD